MWVLMYFVKRVSIYRIGEQALTVKFSTRKEQGGKSLSEKTTSEEGDETDEYSSE